MTGAVKRSDREVLTTSRDGGPDSNVPKPRRPSGHSPETGRSFVNSPRTPQPDTPPGLNHKLSTSTRCKTPIATARDSTCCVGSPGEIQPVDSTRYRERVSHRVLVLQRHFVSGCSKKPELSTGALPDRWSERPSQPSSGRTRKHRRGSQHEVPL